MFLFLIPAKIYPLSDCHNFLMPKVTVHHAKSLKNDSSSWKDAGEWHYLMWPIWFSATVIPVVLRNIKGWWGIHRCDSVIHPSHRVNCPFLCMPLLSLFSRFKVLSGWGFCLPVCGGVVQYLFISLMPGLHWAFNEWETLQSTSSLTGEIKLLSTA